jgi:hypothetical protein
MPTRLQMEGMHGAMLVWYHNPLVRTRLAPLMALDAVQTRSRTGYEVGVDRKVPTCQVSWFVHEFSGAMTGVLVQGPSDRNMFTLRVLRADVVYLLG